MSDFVLLLRLRLRHVWSRAVWWAGTAGADLRSSAPGDRAYVAYLALLLGGWSYLMTGAAIDLIFEATAAAGARALAAASVPWVPAILLAGYLIAGLRETPLKLGFPDLAYVAGSPVSRTTIVGAWFVPGVPLTLVSGCVLGLLIGVAASVAPDSVSAARSALVTAGMIAVAALGARTLGWAVGLLARGGTDMVRLAESSSAYAQYEVYRPLVLYDASAAADIRRRIRLSARRPRGSMPGWSGRRAIVARAITGHFRQPHTLSGPFVLGLVVVPFGMVLLATRQSPVTLLAWLFMVVTLSPRGMIRIHQASAERPWLHHLLSCDELALLALHSAPALAVALCGTAAATALIASLAGSTPVLIILAMALIVLLTLCQGLGTIIVPPLRRPIDYPASALITTGMVASVAYAEGIAWAILTVAGCAVVLALGIRSGSSGPSTPA